MILQFLEKHWLKTIGIIFVAGSLYANIANGFSDHETRTKTIEKSTTEQKESLDTLARESKQMREIMQQMLKVAKGTCLNTSKNIETARLAGCVGD